MPPRGHAQLRVSAGEARGRRLLAPRHIRPTQGLVKEAVFDMLGELTVNAVVLDLFSGSGALGIEALSRGASSATFVDRDEASVSILRRNLESLGFESRARVFRSEAVRWLRAHPEDVAAATVILLDPPYGDPVLDDSLRLLDGGCASGGVVVVEHEKGRSLPSLERLRTSRQRDYGDTSVNVMRAS